MARQAYTDEHIEYLKAITPGRYNDEITKMFNEKFGTNKTERAIKSIRGKHGITTTARNHWPKGHTPWNKGLRGLEIGGKETQFKKGGIPPNTVEVGTEMVDADGYTKVKVAEPNAWEFKHRLIWEEKNGPVPKGHCIIFGDGNRQNLDTDNLICVSRGQLLKLNQHGLIKNDADLTRTGVIIVDLQSKINERKKE